jgi:hypothetical protein
MVEGTMTVVRINQYDLSGGLMAKNSQEILKRKIDGLWACGIVLFGKEYYFANGICVDNPGKTPFGIPT